MSNENLFLGDDINPVLDEVNSSAERHRKRGISAICRRVYEQLEQNGITWDEFLTEISVISAEPSTRTKLVEFRAERSKASEEVEALQPEELPEHLVGDAKNVNRKVKFSRSASTSTPKPNGESGIETDGRADNKAEGQEKGAQ
jgi:hypothetical protein